MSYAARTLPFRPISGLGCGCSMPVAGLGQVIRTSPDDTHTFMTELTPVNVRATVAATVPGAIVTALGRQFGANSANRAGWGSGTQAGRIWVTFHDPDAVNTHREALLRSAIRSAAAAVGSDVILLLPGDTVPTPATTPATTPAVTPAVTSSTPLFHGASLLPIVGGIAFAGVTAAFLYTLASKRAVLAGRRRAR